MTLQETNEFPFHDTLVKYLDTRAPLPSKESTVSLCASVVKRSEIFPEGFLYAPKTLMGIIVPHLMKS